MRSTIRLVTRKLASGATVYSRTRTGRGIHDLLEVVEHDQHRAGPRARARCAPRDRLRRCRGCRGCRRSSAAAGRARARPRAARSTSRRGTGPRWRARPRSRAGSCRCRPARRGSRRGSSPRSSSCRTCGEIVLAADRGRVRRRNAGDRGMRRRRSSGRRRRAMRRSARPAGWRDRRRPESASSSARSNGRYAAVSSRWMRAISSFEPRLRGWRSS